MHQELWTQVASHIDHGDFERAVSFLEDGLANCRSPQFKTLIGLEFTNDLQATARGIREFLAHCNEVFPVRAIYLEMNGFDVNPEEWYFDYFAYKTYEPNRDDLDWLASWDSPRWKSQTLYGLESVQADYKHYGKTAGHKDADTREAAKYATLLVMAKFVSLIQRANSTFSGHFDIPILATAHDFDIVGRFIPRLDEIGETSPN